MRVCVCVHVVVSLFVCVCVHVRMCTCDMKRQFCGPLCVSRVCLLALACAHLFFVCYLSSMSLSLLCSVLHGWFVCVCVRVSCMCVSLSVCVCLSLSVCLCVCVFVLPWCCG